FEDEMQDYQTFAIHCQQEIELSTKSNFLSNSISEEPKRELATQVYQIVWHSATLAAKLECLSIHTYGSICDSARENRTHIKSFDWYASTWSLGDIVEVDFNKKFYSAEIVNFNHDRTQFSMHYLDFSSSKTITVDRALIRIITNTDSGTQTLQVEISGVVKGISMWKITEKEAIMLLWPVYDAQKLSTCHNTINPITGEEWFFISDPMHKHIQGVYEHTCRHATAKATKLTKHHIWLTSWKVEDALALIKELKEISEGTQNPRINTLREIHDWFVRGDKQKTKPTQWISSQCQFDLILSIDGFLEILTFFLRKYLGSVIQPRCILQDMLKGLFGTICQLGGDSSTQTLKSYGHSLNKYQVTALVLSELKSINYGKSDGTRIGINTLTQRDKKCPINNENPHYIYEKHSIRLSQLSPLSQYIFENLLADDLIMGRINFSLESCNSNINKKNIKAFYLQIE
ncbi:3000_t:CDS:2, partial [Cetraspora pellucida]